MEGLEQAMAVLPEQLKDALARVAPEARERAQDIRLRRGAPPLLIMPNGRLTLSAADCTDDFLADTFEYLCEYSVYAHENEIRQGYICTKSGCRAGIAGTAVVKEGHITAMRDVTSICIRIRRNHPGSADAIVKVIAEGALQGVIICGEPSSGKSSLLRDLVISLAGKRQRQIAVVDERGELFPRAFAYGDVLTGYPKAAGVEQALRTLAPEGIAFDEMGNDAELATVLQCLNSGVAAFTTLHIQNQQQLLTRPIAQAALKSGAFPWVVLLKGRRFPGEIARIARAEELFG